MKILSQLLLPCLFATTLLIGQAASAQEQAANQPIIIDVRTLKEYKSGHINQALHIPYEIIDKSISKQIPDKSQPLILYCGSGHRSGIAQKTLQAMGYTQVENGGGLNDMLKRQGHH